DSESTGRLVDADQGSKRRSVGVVYHQEQAKLRRVSKFVCPVGIIGGRHDVAARRNLSGPQVDIDHAASAVGHEEPREGGNHAVRAATVGAAGCRTSRRWYDSGKRRSHGNLPDERRRLGVDDIDGDIRTVGEIVGLSLIVDKTNVV